MPCSVFHMHVRDVLTTAPEGTDLPDLEAARIGALAAARKTLAGPT
jgi:hypothetical protein